MLECWNAGMLECFDAKPTKQFKKIVAILKITLAHWNSAMR